ncbi:MAG: helix-turn-helix domain-containing protein [Clostridia bacterium]|nr:helix-turn-helix domain-containing protein [Clostridia bacterium]
MCYNKGVMKTLKEIIPENLVELRKQNKLTQLELAEKLGYSDKAVSRWEHGEVLPDVETLDKIAEVYGIPIETLFKENPNIKQERGRKSQSVNKLMISLLSVLTVWFLAAVLFFTINQLAKTPPWQIFVLAFPVSCVVGIVFNALWGKRAVTFILISMLIWSLLTFFYLLYIEHNLWLLFIIGIPAQIAVILCSNIHLHR